MATGNDPHNIISDQPRFDTFGACEMVSVIPSHNRWRFYRIAVMPGLFSPIVSRAWGRIGCTVKVKEEFVENMEGAIKRANQLFRERTKNGYQEIKSIRNPKLLKVHPEES